MYQHLPSTGCDRIWWILILGLLTHMYLRDALALQLHCNIYLINVVSISASIRILLFLLQLINAVGIKYSNQWVIKEYENLSPACCQKLRDFTFLSF
jgi:hypothetical protein